MDASAPTLPQADIFSRYFRHSRRYRIVVYVEYRIAIVPKYAAAHLVRNHGRTTKEERRRVQRYIDGLEDVAYDVSDVRFPGPEDAPYSEIPVRYGGLRYIGKDTDGRVYRYVIGSTQMIQAHYKAVHGWQNEQRRGGNVKRKSAQTVNRM
jgi:hypothetical protein